MAFFLDCPSPCTLCQQWFLVIHQNSHLFLPGYTATQYFPGSIAGVALWLSPSCCIWEDIINATSIAKHENLPCTLPLFLFPLPLGWDWKWQFRLDSAENNRLTSKTDAEDDKMCGKMSAWKILKQNSPQRPAHLHRCSKISYGILVSIC